MKTNAILLFAALMMPSAYATSCNEAVEAAVNEKASAKDENSSVISVRRLGNLEELAFRNALLGNLEGYYATTSDESGGCVWHVVATDKCEVRSVEEVACF